MQQPCGRRRCCRPEEAEAEVQRPEGMDCVPVRKPHSSFQRGRAVGAEEAAKAAAKAFENIAVLSLDHAVGGWPVVSGRVMAPPKFRDSFDQFGNSSDFGVRRISVAGRANGCGYKQEPCSVAC